MWGGDDKPQGLQAFQEAIFDRPSHENNAQSNQLAAVDIRYGFTLGSTTLAAYAQLADENTFSNIPKSSVGLAGIEAAGLLWRTHSRLILEASNSIAGLYGSNASINKTQNITAYEHATYTEGYRHLKRPIGANSDANSELLSLTGEHYFDNGHQLTWRHIHANLNQDQDQDGVLHGNHIFGQEATQVGNTQLQYRFPATERLMVEIGVSHLSHSVIYQGETIDSSWQLSLFHHW